MRCRTIERWISDSVDGRLPERKQRKLEDHLLKCSSCGAYRLNIEKIHEVSQGLKMPEKSPSYWEEFSSRLEDRLYSLELPKGTGRLTAVR